MLHKHVTATLPYFNKPQLETRCILEVLATTTQHAAQSPHIRLQQMGSLSPPYLGQDVIEHSSLLQYPLAHGEPTNSTSQGRDQVVIEILFGKNLNTNTLRSLSRCGEALEIIFLSDMTTVNWRYLEQFLLNPGSQTSRCTYNFPKKIQLGEIGRYDSTSGTNTWKQGTSSMSLLKNGWP
jgi:hypothetical protein